MLVRETTEDGNLNAPRVSVSPDFAAHPLSLPDFKGTALERLEACLEALNPSHQAERPTIGNDLHSNFAKNIGRVSEFTQSTLSSECLNGGQEGVSAALYVCGAPGIGKTSGVLWCCDQAISSLNADDGPKPRLSVVNGLEQSWDAILDDLGSTLGFKNSCSEKRIISALRKGKVPVLMVVDEIDALVAIGSSKFEGLKKLLQWANDPEAHLALIGISNSMNDEKAHEIREAGEVRNPCITL